MVKHTIVLVGCLASSVAFADGRLAGRVTDLSDQPVKDASVFITGAKGLEVTVTTDPTGHYEAKVPTAGPHTVIFAFGNRRVAQKVNVPDGGSATLDSVLEVGGEIIEVKEAPRPLINAKPKSDPLAIPTYSDKAALGDRWAKAWMLLDVSDRGIVTRVKFLKRPGYDLDEIAVRHAFNLTFDPARNKKGFPAASYVVWPLEWPALDWLKLHQFTATRMPTMLDTVQVDGGIIVTTYPPCGAEKGDGVAWNFGDGNNDSHHIGLRDCSVPDFSTMDATEPWIFRDASVPPPVVAEAAWIDPVKFHQDQIDAAHSARTQAIVATAATGAFVAATVYAFARFGKASDRVDADNGQHTTVLPAGQLQADQTSMRNWELGAVGFATGALVSGLASAYFWKRSSDLGLVLQPNAEGASLSLSGKF